MSPCEPFRERWFIDRTIIRAKARLHNVTSIHMAAGGTAPGACLFSNHFCCVDAGLVVSVNLVSVADWSIF